MDDKCGYVGNVVDCFFCGMFVGKFVDVVGECDDVVFGLYCKVVGVYCWIL